MHYKLLDLRYELGRVGVVLGLLVGLLWRASAQEMAQQFKQFEIDQGATLYYNDCAECHTDGAGVPGVNFHTSQFPSGSKDEDIISAIRNGIPGTTMPPHDFSAGEVTALLAYIRSLAQADGSPVKLGDPAKGQVLYEQSGCSECHRVGTEGAHLALNLTDTGALHPPSFLQRALLDPSSVLKQEPESRLVRIVTKKGQIINGRRMNEDTYTLQIMDDHENLVSVEKSELRAVSIVEESPMPSERGKLTGDQLSDLVAYLASLKGGAQPVTSYGSAPKIGSAYVTGARGGAATPTAPPAPASTQPVPGAGR